MKSWQILIVGCLLAASGAGFISHFNCLDACTASQGRKVAVVRLDGAIMDPVDFVRWMRQLTTEVDGLRAIVLAINSPGGGVAASQELYTTLKKAREDGLVIVASMGSLAASGAYYAACATDLIFCQPGTLTGSIGVIAEFPNAEKLLDTVGLKFQVVKSGLYKDAGNPGRSLTPAEQKLFQDLIDDVYSQFVGAVVDSRREALSEAILRADNRVDKSKLDDEALGLYLKQFADGRLVSGRQAVEIGLADKLGDLDDAIMEAAKMAGIEGEPEVVIKRQKRHWADPWMAGAAREFTTAISRWMPAANAPVQFKAF